MAKPATLDLGAEDPRRPQAAAGAWSIVHGFATLWLNGNLAGMAMDAPADDAAASCLSEFGATLFAAAGMTEPPAGAQPRSSD